MQTIGSKIIFTLFVICCLGLSGCGSDTYNGDYTTTVSFQDGGEDGAMTLDMTQIPDCDGDPATDDPETFTDVLADITVNVAEFAPGIVLDRFTIEYLPVLSADGTGAMVQPPTLNILADPLSYNTYVASGSSEVITLPCFSTAQKAEYVLLVGALDPSQITVRYVLRFTDDNGEGVTLEVRRTVYFGYYNRCGGGD